MPVSRRDFLAASVALGAPFPAAAAATASQAGDPELAYLGVHEAARLIRTRRLSPVELAQALLDRIERLNPRLQAFLTVVREPALAAAREAEREIAAGRYRGPLHGVPFGVKDTHYTAGILTTAASPVLADFVPDHDATVVRRLKQAGAVLIGKTNLPEFSFGGAAGGGAFPDARNPWDTSRTPGGSSSGSAVALAAGLLPMATGGDTSGSIRNPASLCGVVGMKPSYGRVSRHGIVAISWSLDHVGPMTRSVADNALLLSALAGADPADETCSRRPVPDYARALTRGAAGLRVGLPRPALFEGFHPDALHAFDEARRVLEGLGARVREVELPATLEVVDELQSVVRICEAASYHERFLETRGERYPPTSVRRDLDAGAMITAVQYLRAQKVRGRFQREMRELFEEIDLLATPGMPAAAGEPARPRQPFRRLWNVCGFPALVLPAGFSRTVPRLPVSLQLAAAPWQEETIYAAAAAYEGATGWRHERPPL